MSRSLRRFFQKFLSDSSDDVDPVPDYSAICRYTYVNDEPCDPCAENSANVCRSLDGSMPGTPNGSPNAQAEQNLHSRQSVVADGQAKCTIARGGFRGAQPKSLSY